MITNIVIILVVEKCRHVSVQHQNMYQQPPPHHQPPQYQYQRQNPPQHYHSRTSAETENHKVCSKLVHITNLLLRFPDKNESSDLSSLYEVVTYRKFKIQKRRSTKM